MRLTYLDESGTSAREPLLVVAGVIIDGDKQYKAIDERMRGLVEKHIPEGHRAGFIFHATDIFSGNKPIFSEMGVHARIAIFDDLAAVINEFRLPVVWGSTHKAHMAEIVPDQPYLQTRHGQFEVGFMASYGDCLLAAEYWMKRYANDEQVMIIAENNSEIRRHLKRVHALLTQGPVPEELKSALMAPLGRIIDTLHFAEKGESPMLQLADFCAFVIKGYFSGNEKLKKWFGNVFASMLWRYKREDLERIFGKEISDQFKL